MAQIVKRPRVIVDIEEHAWFILQDNVEAGLRFAEACDAESLAWTVEALWPWATKLSHQATTCGTSIARSSSWLRIL